MALFQTRFGLLIRDYEGDWTARYVTMVWDSLDCLPDDHVSDNTALAAFDALKQGGGGHFSSSEDAIRVGVGFGGAIGLSHTVRHEVGHAVHHKMAGAIDAWLRDEVGFYPIQPLRMHTTILDLGGYPAEFDDDMKIKVVEMLESFMGGGSSFAPARRSASALRSGARRHNHK